MSVEIQYLKALEYIRGYLIDNEEVDRLLLIELITEAVKTYEYNVKGLQNDFIR